MTHPGTPVRRRRLPVRPQDWPRDLREDWEERAALIEYDVPRVPRAVAERMAEEQIRDRVERQGEGRQMEMGDRR